MNAYRAGLTCWAAPQEQSRYHVGAMIATPGFIKDAANALNADVRAFDAELGSVRAAWGLVRDADLPPEQMAQDLWWHNNWVPFLTAWNKFWEDHGNRWGLANVYHNFWGSAWGSVQEYRAKLLALRASARNVGFVLTSPEPAPPQDGWFPSATAELWKLAKTVIYAALAVVGGVLVWKFFIAVRGGV